MVQHKHTKWPGFSCQGSDISHPRWRDVWWRGCCLLPGDAAAHCSWEPVGMTLVTSFVLSVILSTITSCFSAFVSRDRVSCVWQTVRDHLCQLCVHANESCFLVERAVVGLLRLAIRLLRREDISSQVYKDASWPWHTDVVLQTRIIIKLADSLSFRAA